MSTILWPEKVKDKSHLYRCQKNRAVKMFCFVFLFFFRKIVPNNPSERYRLRVIRRDAKKQAADLKMTFLSNQLAPWNVPELWNAPEGSSADWAIPSDRAKNRSNVLCSKRSQRDFLTWIRSSKFTRARLNRLTYKTPPGQRVQL